VRFDARVLKMAIALLKRTSPSAIFAAIKSTADTTRINTVSREVSDGRVFWLKSRTPGSGRIIRCANIYFLLARNPVRVLGRADVWQQCELDSFLLLNGDRFCATADGEFLVRLENIPGESLCDLLTREKLTGVMIDAAACELARVHALRSERLGGLWSHGDARLANFIFDEKENRARLIDFEVMHTAALTSDARHADDLLVFLQDLMGRLPDERWLPDALRFVNAYGRREVIDALKTRLVVPAFGVPRLWWAIRTRYTPRAKLVHRAKSLRENLP
jgi:hypothetical protein